MWNVSFGSVQGTPATGSPCPPVAVSPSAKYRLPIWWLSSRFTAAAMLGNGGGAGAGAGAGAGPDAGGVVASPPPPQPPAANTNSIDNQCHVVPRDVGRGTSFFM